MTAEVLPRSRASARLAAVEPACRHHDAQITELARRLHDSTTALAAIHLALKAGEVESATDLTWLAILQAVDAN